MKKTILMLFTLVAVSAISTAFAETTYNSDGSFSQSESNGSGGSTTYYSNGSTSQSDGHGTTYNSDGSFSQSN